VDKKHLIARRAAKEIPNNAWVNLGFGMPVIVAKYLQNRHGLHLFGENGIVGYEFSEDIRDPNMIDGGTNWAKLGKNTCYMDSASAFGIVRGGHLDISVLGGLQVSKNGDLANWYRGSGIGGVGGGVDMATCANKVIVVMEHVDKEGNPKIVNKCTLPLTAPRCVDLIVTDMAVIEISDGELTIKELLNGHTFDEVQKLTEVRLCMAKKKK
jgi:3-oxoacid CoA-transferase B subunit